MPLLNRLRKRPEINLKYFTNSLRPIERRIIRYYAHGYSRKEVAALCNISNTSVNRHVANIKIRTGQPAKTWAAAYALWLYKAAYITTGQDLEEICNA